MTLLLYTSQQSVRQWDVLRIDSHAVKRPTIKKSHVGKPCCYNNDVLLSALETQSVNIRNWTRLAKDKTSQSDFQFLSSQCWSGEQLLLLFVFRLCCYY